MMLNSNNKTCKNELHNFPGVIYRRVKSSNGDFSYEFINDEIYNILEIDKGSDIVVSSKGYLDATHWADRYLISQQIEESEKSQKSYIERFRIITKNGNICWLAGKVIPSKGEKNETIWDGYLFDETSKKQTEQKLNIILESSNDLIINTDHNGTITEINNAVSDMFGYEASFIIGKNISTILAPEDKEECNNYIEQYLEKEKDLYGEAKAFEFLALKKNGDYFPIEFNISALRIQGELSFIIIIKDIMEQKTTLATLKDTEDKLSTIVSALPCAFFTIYIGSEDDYKIIYLSDGSLDLFKMTPEAFYNNSKNCMQTILDDTSLKSYISKLVNKKALSYFDEEIPNPINNDYWMQVRIKPEAVEGGSIICHGIMLDVTEKKKAAEKVRYLAYHHHLTGTANRSLLGKEMLSMIETAEAKNEKISILSIGSNNLNLFYTTSGHDIGDMILKEMSDRIKNNIEDDNFLAYTTSGLFVVTIPNAGDEEKTKTIIDKILQAFVDPIIVNDQFFDMNLNIGISVYPEHGTDTNSLIKNSSAALDKAKKDYKEYKFFTEEIRQSIKNANTLRSKLRKALDDGEIIPFFQPQIEIATGKIVGTEALARWISNDGIVSPGVFIPIAEEYGLIDYISEVILEKACEQNQRWIEQGILSVPVAVNISPRQFHNPKSLLKMVNNVLHNTKLPPKMLEIELTESSTMINPVEAERIIKILLDKGITCSIDDFGTGYSSLSVLKKFPLSKLKIDRSFVVDITNDTNDASIVSATIAMAKALNLKVLAEGVETKDIYQFLSEIGCTSIQGFLFSKALPADEMTEFAKNWNPKEIIENLKGD